MRSFFSNNPLYSASFHDGQKSLILQVIFERASVVLQIGLLDVFGDVICFEAGRPRGSAGVLTMKKLGPYRTRYEDRFRFLDDDMLRFKGEIEEGWVHQSRLYDLARDLRSNSSLKSLDPTEYNRREEQMFFVQSDLQEVENRLRLAIAPVFEKHFPKIVSVVRNA